jgi:hypothetical protein
LHVGADVFGIADAEVGKTCLDHVVNMREKSDPRRGSLQSIGKM